MSLKTTVDQEWSVPSPPPTLTNDDVHVWRADLEQPADQLAKLANLLSEDEQARANRFHFERDRRRFTVGRGILRTLLGQYLEVAPEALQFDYGSQGKPCLTDACNPNKLQFNLTHSHELALYAFTYNRDLGIDIEYLRPMPDLESIATRFFSKNEQRKLLALPKFQQEEAFFTCWTRKEAYIKAIGEGLTMPLDEFDVSLTPDEPPAILEIRKDPAQLSRWSLQALHPASEYKAALVIANYPGKMTRWRWSAL